MQVPPLVAAGVDQHSTFGRRSSRRSAPPRHVQKMLDLTFWGRGDRVAGGRARQPIHTGVHGVLGAARARPATRGTRRTTQRCCSGWTRRCSIAGPWPTSVRSPLTPALVDRLRSRGGSGAAGLGFRIDGAAVESDSPALLEAC